MSKIFLTNAATSTSAEQLPSGSLNFIEQGIAENTDYLTFGLAQAITGATTFATASAYIIFGVQPIITGGGSIVAFTQGAILWNGEILYVPAFPATTVGSLDGFYANITDYYDPTLDPIQFSDGTFNYCNRYRTLTISTPSPTGLPGTFLFLGYQLDNFTNGNQIYLPTVPAQIAKLKANSWTTLSPTAPFTSGPNTPRVTMDGLNRVCIQGAMTVNSGATAFSGTQITTIPVGMRPTQTIGFPLFVYNNAAPTFYITAPAYVTTSGGVFYAGLTLNQFSYVDLSGINYTANI